MMNIEDASAFVAAVMKAAGVKEVKVPHEWMEGFLPEGITVSWWDDVQCDWRVFRLIEAEEIIDAEIVEDVKEIGR